jgi:hypothetical protein
MLNRGDSGRSLENLRENIELMHDDRTGFKVHIDDLVEDPSSPGVLTLPQYIDSLDFEQMKSDSPKDRYNHYFRT